MQRAQGFALTTCLLLLMAFTTLALAGFTAALVEQRIAANLELRERAFQAAEFGVEQALQSTDLATSLTPDAPRSVPANGAPVPLPDSTADGYAYRLYLAAVTPSGLPAHDPASALTAFHFVIEASGYSARGAADTHVQSFKVLRPADWTGGPAIAGCAPADVDCDPTLYPPPVRTSWVQLEAE
jgi:type IV pilus assembly protein PilX